MLATGWTTTLRDLLGAPVERVAAEDIVRLVEQEVRETDELDFKATLYAKTDDGKEELCKDIAGLRNHRGGALLLGVGDKNAVANGCPEVALSDGEERRMRQIVASGTAPHAAFEIRAIKGKKPGKGFYLLIAEPSLDRPHAVLVGEGLRYPRRDGTTTRYLTEPEVADAYRDRFRGATHQIERLGQITDETITRLDREDPFAWLVVSIVPGTAGDLAISFSGRNEIERWAREEHHVHDIVDGFFEEMAPVAGVSVERYVLTSPGDNRRPTLKYPYAVCFTDGAASAAVQIRTGISHVDTRVVLAPHLVCAAATALRLTARHAVRAGARGDAVVTTRLLAPDVRLGWDHSGLTEMYENSRTIKEARSYLTLPLDSLAGDDYQAVLAATRLTLTDIFNGFGLAEVPQITGDGTVRTRVFPEWLPGLRVGGAARRRNVRRVRPGTDASRRGLRSTRLASRSWRSPSDTTRRPASLSP